MRGSLPKGRGYSHLRKAPPLEVRGGGSPASLPVPAWYPGAGGRFSGFGEDKGWFAEATPA
jgi:hypothetical protein